QRNAHGTFGNELVGWRSGDHGGLLGTLAGAPIALAVIAAAMGANFDFQDVAVGGAGNFLERLAAIGTALLVVGQRTVFVRGGQVVVCSSAMALTAPLLSTRTPWSFSRRGRGIGWRLGRGGGFGFASEQPAFQLADFTLKVLDLLLQLGFTLDGPLMPGPPIVGLHT